MAEDVSLLEELSADQGSMGSKCGVAVVMLQLPPEQRDEWNAAMRNPAFTAASIYRAAVRRDVPFSEQSVQRHVRRLRSGQGCQCPR